METEDTDGCNESTVSTTRSEQIGMLAGAKLVLENRTVLSSHVRSATGTVQKNKSSLER